MKPILFNTEMVRAILDGRKTVTRRVIKTESGEPLRYGLGFVIAGDRKSIGKYAYGNRAAGEPMRCVKPPYKVNDILYVRETWALEGESENYITGEKRTYYAYKADPFNRNGNWRPSIHMPKEAARIFLKVTGVRVERLWDMRLDDFKNEGTTATSISPEDDLNYRFNFSNLWDSTIKKDQLQYYSWGANPYVWVIEFEVIDKAAALKEGQA